MKIAGKVFVVTGGGNGIGREVVLGLLERGAHVAAVDLKEDSLAETATLATAAAKRLTTHSINVTDREAVLTLPSEIIEAHGQVDGLLNIAGIVHPFVPIAELDFEAIERVFNVNFWGVVNMTKAFLPALMKRPEAAVLNVSSIGGFIPVPGQGAYNASKAAVKMFTESLYAESFGTNLAVTIVFPGGVGTSITENSGVDKEIPGSDDKPTKGYKTTSPAEAGRQIIEGLKRGSLRVRIGSDAKALDRLTRLMPRRAIEMIVKATKRFEG